ncbi:hypothetical protein HY095_04610 [Candidatus Micrarchaeota archaeon]|nr:hypothetical protein [Candidatus Micrarchaeota archaeon]
MPIPLRQAWLLAALVAANASGFTGEEEIIAGLLPSYPNPPFETAAQFNAQAKCCSLGIPPGWRGANSSAHELAAAIAYLQPEVHVPGGKRTLANRTGTARIFLWGMRKTPGELWDESPCPNEVTRTDAKELFEASFESAGARREVTAVENDNPGREKTTRGERWPAQWPEGNETTVNYGGVAQGDWNFTISYGLQTAYAIRHFQSIPVYSCNSVGCVVSYACREGELETRTYYDAVNGSAQITIPAPASGSVAFFNDGPARRMRLILNAPQAGNWRLDANGASASGRSAAYAIYPGPPPYNISHVTAIPRNYFSTRGLFVQRGTLNSTHADALLATTGAYGAKALLTLGTPFEQAAFAQSQDAMPSALYAIATTLPNGTSLLALALRGGSARPLGQEKIEVTWMGRTEQLTTDPQGMAVASREAAAGSQAEAWYDSDGRFASQSALAQFETPASRQADTEGAVFFLGGCALLAAGLTLTTGRHPKTLLPWLGKAVAAGLALWIISKTVSS